MLQMINQGIKSLQRDFYIIKALTVFRTKVHAPTFVFYPCCGLDSSPSDVFNLVLYLDKNKRVTDLFLQNGMNAFTMDIDEFQPRGPFDLVILLNPEENAEKFDRFVKDYVFCNNYHGTGTQLNQSSEYSLHGSITEGRFSRNKEGLFVPVNSIEELDERRLTNYTRRKAVCEDTKLPYKKEADFYIFKKN